MRMLKRMVKRMVRRVIYLYIYIYIYICDGVIFLVAKYNAKWDINEPSVDRGLRTLRRRQLLRIGGEGVHKRV